MTFKAALVSLCTLSGSPLRGLQSTIICRICASFYKRKCVDVTVIFIYGTTHRIETTVYTGATMLL